MLEKLKKRYWVYHSPEYECSTGFTDFAGSTDSLADAITLANSGPEWKTIFDSETGEQMEKTGKKNRGFRVMGKVI